MASEGSQSTKYGRTLELTVTQPRELDIRFYQPDDTTPIVRHKKHLYEPSAIPFNQITTIPFPWTHHPVTNAPINFVDLQRNPTWRLAINKTEPQRLPPHLNPDSYRNRSMTKEQYAEDKEDAVLCLWCGQKYWGKNWWRRYRKHISNHSITVPTRSNTIGHVVPRSKNVRNTASVAKDNRTQYGEKIAFKSTSPPPSTSRELLDQVSVSTSVAPSAPSPAGLEMAILDWPSPPDAFFPHFIEESQTPYQPTFDPDQNLATLYDPDFPIPTTTNNMTQLLEDFSPLATTDNFGIDPTMLNPSVPSVSTFPTGFPPSFSMAPASSPYVAQAPPVQSHPNDLQQVSSMLPCPVDENFSFTFPVPSVPPPFFHESFFLPGNTSCDFQDPPVATAMTPAQILQSSFPQTQYPTGGPSNGVHGRADDFTFDQPANIKRRRIF